MMKKLPVGVDGFEDIITQDFYYVDKTLFIADLLKNWGKVNLFTRPRRFGKTLLMDMLKEFFEIGCRRELFRGLNISRQESLCQEYMGQFPVVSLTLKSANGLNYQEATAALRRVIGTEALRFSFLRESPALTPEEKELYRALIHVEEGRFTMADELLTDSLRTLTQLLSRHYGKKALLFIDEYDVPLDKAFQYGYYEKMISLIRNLFGNALKSNPSLHFAVITGCLRISRESIFTGLNNLKVYTVTAPRFHEYFGFTEEEVDRLLAAYGLESHKDDIKNWYDGYQFGKESIYCPWDVINYCDELLADPEIPPRDYWSNTSENALVKRFIYKADQTVRDEIEQLVNGKTVLRPIKQELTYPDLDSSTDNLWSILFSTGYLTLRGNAYGEELELAIPNKEILKLFIRLTGEWFKDTSRADLSRIGKFCSAFPEGDAARIEGMLRDYLWDSISVRDTAVRKSMKENFYHGMLLGLLKSRADWIVRSNEETGNGYSDITICTPERTGIVIECKYADDGNLEKGCAEALKQISEKKYDAGLQRRQMKKILKYGIAFWEKECKVAMAKGPERDTGYGVAKFGNLYHA